MHKFKNLNQQELNLVYGGGCGRCFGEPDPYPNRISTCDCKPSCNLVRNVLANPSKYDDDFSRSVLSLAHQCYELNAPKPHQNPITVSLLKAKCLLNKLT